MEATLSNHTQQGGGVGPQMETQSLAGKKEYGRQTARNPQLLRLGVTGKCPQQCKGALMAQQALSKGRFL